MSFATTTLAVKQKLHEDEDILFFVPKSKESYRKILLTYSPFSNNNQLIRNFVKIAKQVYLKK